MSKIDIDKACEQNLVTDFLNNKIDEGGGGIGASKKYVDQQDALLQTNIDDANTSITAEETARTDEDIAINKRIDDIVPPDTSGFALKEELDTEYIESDPYPAIKNEDGTPKSKLMLNTHLTGLQDQIFTSKEDIDILEAGNKSLEARIKALEDAGGGTGDVVNGTGVKTILLQYGSGFTETDLYISEDDYNKNKDFVIDENYLTYYTTGVPWHIVIPYAMDANPKASSKIIRFRRLHGVNMEYYGVPPLVIEGMSVRKENSVRISIASENSDGTLTEIQDLVYKNEYIDIQVTYNANGGREECILLTELPFLKVETSMAGVMANFALPDFDEYTKDAYTDLRLGIPFSQMLTWDPVTDDGAGNPLVPHWEYNLSFMVKIGVLDPTNPFYRSIKDIPDDQWTDLIFPVQVPDGSDSLDVVITDYQISKDINYRFIMRETPVPTEEDPNPNPMLYTLPLGKHFPRFEQKGAWDSNRHTPFKPNTTGEHTHEGGSMAVSISVAGDNSSSSTYYANPRATSTNSGNISYETAPNYLGVQGWIYL